MFDYVRCRYPLPHHQDAEFQTKDMARIVDPGDPIDGLLDRYVITKTGRLRRQLHKRKAVKTGRTFPSVVLKSIKSWWVLYRHQQWPPRSWPRDAAAGFDDGRSVAEAHDVCSSAPPHADRPGFNSVLVRS